MSTILRHKYVTTRKPHICFGCGRNILSPARMASMAYADGGTAESYCLCKTCDAITSRMDSYDEYGFGELREEALKMERESYQCG
jgi:hypothetical protein